MQAPPLLRAMRPHQWSKNVFVLAGLAFALGDDNLAFAESDWRTALTQVLLAFGAFCLGSSAIYLLNDVVDVESDRQHPEKRHRPIAAGELGAGTAKVASLACAGLALALGWLSGPTVCGLVAVYMTVNLAYSFVLKQIVLVDAFCIAGGFLLRVVAGGAAAGVDISRWLILCTLFLALFLALNKRRSEISLLGEDKAKHRAILAQYDLGFLDQMVTALAACTIVCYALYTIDASTAAKYGEDNRLYWSVPFVVFGIARYMLLVQTGSKGGNPTAVFLGGDKLFLTNIVGWAAVVAAAVFGWI